MHTLDQPFEYCALRFLIQWEQRERALHEQISAEPTSQQVRSALRHFQVARSFAGLQADGAAQAVADALHQVASDPNSSPVQKVVGLAFRFEKRFNRFNLSAASKLLWLRHRLPYIIYDSRAAKALRVLGCAFEDGDYPEYVRAWRDRYSEREKAIRIAASRLYEIRTFLPRLGGSGADLTTLTAQPWFLERVFDIYLWEMGARSPH